MIRFFDMLILLVLSHFNEMHSIFTLKSQSCCFNQSIYAQQLPATIYYVYAVLSATQACFLHDRDTGEFPRMLQVLLVLFMSFLHPS